MDAEWKLWKYSVKIQHNDGAVGYWVVVVVRVMVMMKMFVAILDSWTVRWDEPRCRNHQFELGSCRRSHRSKVGLSTSSLGKYLFVRTRVCVQRVVSCNFIITIPRYAPAQFEMWDGEEKKSKAANLTSSSRVVLPSAKSPTPSLVVPWTQRVRLGRCDQARYVVRDDRWQGSGPRAHSSVVLSPLETLVGCQ